MLDVPPPLALARPASLRLAACCAAVALLSIGCEKSHGPPRPTPEQFQALNRPAPPRTAQAVIVASSARNGKCAWITEVDKKSTLMLGGVGEAPRAIASGVGWRGVALDGDAVWVLQAAGERGSLLRAPLSAGSSPAVVQPDLKRPAGLYLAGGGLCWTESDPPGVFRPVAPAQPQLRIRSRDRSGTMRELAAWPAPGETSHELRASIIGEMDGQLYVRVPSETCTEFVRVPLNGGDPARVALETGGQEGALYHGAFFWTAPSEEGGAGAYQVCIKRPASGGESTVVTDWLPAGGSLLSGRSGLRYVKALEGVFAVPASFGLPQPLSFPADSGMRATSDGTTVLALRAAGEPALAIP